MQVSKIYHLHEIGGKKNQEDYIWPVGGKATVDDKIFIVCDGVGGSENGELASMIVSQVMAKELSSIAPDQISLDYIDRVITTAKSTLVQHVRAHGLNADMATTFTLLILFPDKAFIAWCGDSRVYHVRKGEIMYKTVDHSLVNTLVRKGAITEDEARLHPQKNIILKAVKADESRVEYEFHWINEVQEGDYFMLCTDGVLENISDWELSRLLSEADKESIDVVESMQLLCENKTRDNYSMYLVQVSPTAIENPKSKSRKYLVTVMILLMIASVMAFAQYFSQNKSILQPASIKRSPDTAKAVFLSSDSSVENKPVDSLIPAPIVLEQPPADATEASPSIIQPIEPENANAKDAPIPDSIKVRKQNRTPSKPVKKDSSSLITPTN